MRVIAGTKRHLPLKTLKGMSVRPTTDRTKETLFNILAPRLPGCRFLDLFGGSGAIGIEAMSRGAGETVIVEKDREALACIRDNLRTTGLSASCRLLAMDSFAALSRLEEEKKPFDLIFLDPPYGLGLERQALVCLSDSVLVSEDTWVVVEALLPTDLSYAGEYGWELFREKEYKTNKHAFFCLAERAPEGGGTQGTGGAESR